MAKRKLIPPTDEEDRRITEAARSDPDNPPLEDIDPAKLRFVCEGMPPEIRRMQRRRGPQKRPKKVPVTIRLAPDLAESYRHGEPGFTERVEQALRKAKE